MSTLIFGAGAIGQWLGALLHSSGSDVHLHCRPSVAKALAAQGGIILNGGSPIDVPSSSTQKAIKKKKFTTVISTVKTYAVESALADIKKLGLGFEQLVSFQNGWGTEGLYEEAFPDTDLWTITTTRSVGIERAGYLTPSNKGGLAVAPWTQSPSTGMPECLRRISIPLVELERGIDLKWSKLILNLIGNATGAITGLSPEKLADHPQLMKTELALVRECMAVGRALGVKRSDLPGFSVKILSGALEKLPMRIVEPLISSRMRRARGSKLPSLFFDLEDPSRPTEIDNLNGAVASEGERIGVPTPKHTALTQLFHQCRMDPLLWQKIRETPALMLDFV